MAKKVRVTFETDLPEGATLKGLRDFIFELTWVGGNRFPGSDEEEPDPFFHSIKVRKVRTEVLS